MEYSPRQLSLRKKAIAKFLSAVTPQRYMPEDVTEEHLAFFSAYRLKELVKPLVVQDKRKKPTATEGQLANKYGIKPTQVQYMFRQCK